MKKSSDPRQMTLLDLASGKISTCERCGGTILPPTIGGVSRGSCHCSHEAAREKPTKSALKSCCKNVIATYESDYPHAALAKSRAVASINPGGRVGLYCKACEARLEYDGNWNRIGGL